MKRIILSLVSATAISFAATANMTITSTTSTINVDVSNSVGKTIIYVWKNGRYFTRLNSSKAIPLTSDSYKFLLVASDSSGRKYKLIKKKFTEDGGTDTKKDEKPVISLSLTTVGTTTTIDASKSTDDKKITSYRGYIWKNGKFIKALSQPTTSLVLEPASYKLIYYVMDNAGQKSKYVVKTWKVIEPEPIVEPEPIPTPIENPDNPGSTPTNPDEPNYTLGTASEKVANPITAEFKLGGFLSQVKAQAAYQQGWTGKGVNVAVVDSGIDYNHLDLDDNIKSYTSVIGGDGFDDNGHGTHVAGIIAAEKNGQGMHGVAYDANIISIKVLDQYGKASYKSVGAGIKASADLEAKVANVSIGGGYFSATYHNYLVEDIRYALKNDTSLIFAAGNSAGQCKDIGYTNTGKCSYPAALPVYNDYQDLIDGSLDGAYIAVGSVKADNTLAYYSNAAGITKDWYMVAPGGDVFDAGTYGSMILSTKSSGESSSILDGGSTTTTYKQGTSMAAPVVTGSFALLAQKFPYLVGTEIRDILFATTTDLGEEGVDEIYGHGLLNIEKAMMPVGDMNIPTGGYVTSTSPKYNANRTLLATSSAFGSALAIDPLKSTLILDDFNRGYNIDMTSNVSTTTMAFSMDQLQKIPLDKGFNFAFEDNDNHKTISMGKQFENFNVQFAHSNNLFGAYGNGAMSLEGSTNYLSFNTDITSNISFGAILGQGKGSVGGIFTDISTVTGYGANIDYNNDNLMISLAMPLKVSSGTLSASVPDFRGLDGEIEYINYTSSIKPKGTQIDIASSYRLDDSFTLSSNYTQDMMNIEGMDNYNINLDYYIKF